MDIFEHYGLDWLGMILSVIAIYFLGNKKRQGFLLMMAGNVAWIGFGCIVNSSATIIMNVVFIGMNIWGFNKWSPAATEPTQ